MMAAPNTREAPATAVTATAAAASATVPADAKHHAIGPLAASAQSADRSRALPSPSVADLRNRILALEWEAKEREAAHQRALAADRDAVARFVHAYAQLSAQYQIACGTVLGSAAATQMAGSPSDVGPPAGAIAALPAESAVARNTVLALEWRQQQQEQCARAQSALVDELSRRFLLPAKEEQRETETRIRCVPSGESDPRLYPRPFLDDREGLPPPALDNLPRGVVPTQLSPHPFAINLLHYPRAVAFHRATNRVFVACPPSKEDNIRTLASAVYILDGSSGSVLRRITETELQQQAGAGDKLQLQATDVAVSNSEGEAGSDRLYIANFNNFLICDLEGRLLQRFGAALPRESSGTLTGEGIAELVAAAAADRLPDDALGRSVDCIAVFDGRIYVGGPMPLQLSVYDSRSLKRLWVQRLDWLRAWRAPFSFNGVEIGEHPQHAWSLVVARSIPAAAQSHVHSAPHSRSAAAPATAVSAERRSARASAAESKEALANAIGEYEDGIDVYAICWCVKEWGPANYRRSQGSKRLCVFDGRGRLRRRVLHTNPQLGELRPIAIALDESEPGRSLLYVDAGDRICVYRRTPAGEEWIGSFRRSFDRTPDSSRGTGMAVMCPDAADASNMNAAAHGDALLVAELAAVPALSEWPLELFDVVSGFLAPPVSRRRLLMTHCRGAMLVQYFIPSEH